MSVKERAQKVHQEHVFAFFDQLDEADQKKLEADVGALPLDDLANMFKGIRLMK